MAEMSTSRRADLDAILAQAYHWTDGRAIVATGSPFAPVTMPNGGPTLYPSQCNNMYVFPGLGLAASVAGVKEITDQMLYVAAVACVDAMLPEEIASGRTFPDISRIRQARLLPAAVVSFAGRPRDACARELSQRRHSSRRGISALYLGAGLAFRRVRGDR